MPLWAWIVAGVVVAANAGALIFAFLRFRATRDLPPTLPETIQAPLDADGITPSARLRELESKLQSIERAFNDLHSTVETRHRSLTGFIAKKMGSTRALPADDDDDEQPVRAPKSAFEKLAELEAAHAPPQAPPANGARRHLRRF